MTFWGVVVAGGAGRRFGAQKHGVHIGGKPLWQWGVDALKAGGASGVVVVGPVPGGIAGGASRSDSVAAGLAQVPNGIEYVLVHDAARPLASADLVKRVADRLQVGDVSGVIPAVPIADTLKSISGEQVTSTVDRTNLVAVQTPQGFRTEDLKAAHRSPAAGFATDDAMLLEASGLLVVTVIGEPSNLKLTYDADLAVLEALASMR